MASATRIGPVPLDLRKRGPVVWRHPLVPRGPPAVEPPPTCGGLHVGDEASRDTSHHVPSHAISSPLTCSDAVRLSGFEPPTPALGVRTNPQAKPLNCGSTCRGCPGCEGYADSAAHPSPTHHCRRWAPKRPSLRASGMTAASSTATQPRVRGDSRDESYRNVKTLGAPESRYYATASGTWRWREIRACGVGQPEAVTIDGLRRACR